MNRSRSTLFFALSSFVSLLSGFEFCILVIRICFEFRISRFEFLIDFSLCLSVFVAEKPVQKSAKKRAFLFIFAQNVRIFVHFCAFFTQLFEYFQMFLSVFALPILPKPHNLTNQPPLLP